MVFGAGGGGCCSLICWCWWCI